VNSILRKHLIANAENFMKAEIGLKMFVLQYLNCVSQMEHHVTKCIALMNHKLLPFILSFLFLSYASFTLEKAKKMEEKYHCRNLGVKKGTFCDKPIQFFQLVDV
jgi:hypothetical protein